MEIRTKKEMKKVCRQYIRLLKNAGYMFFTPTYTSDFEIKVNNILKCDEPLAVSESPFIGDSRKLVIQFCKKCMVITDNNIPVLNICYTEHDTEAVSIIIKLYQEIIDSLQPPKPFIDAEISFEDTIYQYIGTGQHRVGIKKKDSAPYHMNFYTSSTNSKKYKKIEFQSEFPFDIEFLKKSQDSHFIVSEKIFTYIIKEISFRK